MDSTIEALPCPLCRSPYTNLARSRDGTPHSIFCKACHCQAPIAAWSVRRLDYEAASALLHALRSGLAYVASGIK